MTLALLCQFTAQHVLDVNTSKTCWAVNWHNKASVIKLGYLYSNDFNAWFALRIKKQPIVCVIIML